MQGWMNAATLGKIARKLCIFPEVFPFWEKKWENFGKHTEFSHDFSQCMWVKVGFYLATNTCHSVGTCAALMPTFWRTMHQFIRWQNATKAVLA